MLVTVTVLSASKGPSSSWHRQQTTDRVYGIDCLRIADASIMPRIATGNTMAACVVIGEQAADLTRQTHGI
jgi:choline dehydrogenase-like flavoprotein